MKYLLLGSVCLLATGCTSVNLVKTSPENINALKGKPLTTVTYKKQDFTAFTAGKAAFGLVGALAAISAGNEIIEKNSVEDPAIQISKDLKVKLAEKFNLTESKSVVGFSKDTSDEIIKASGAGDIALDVKTLGWMFNYFPSNWTHYRVTYSARARLIDTTTGKLIAQVPCTYVSDDEKTAATYDQLLENNAALLKTKLENASKACSTLFTQNMITE